MAARRALLIPIDASKIADGTVSNTEFQYLGNVTSDIQTQINAISGGAVTVGTSTITGGANTKVLYNNSGVLGEYTVSGSGNVAMTTSPTFTTPNLGTPSALTLTNATGLPPTTGISGWPANASGVLTNNGSGTLSWAAGGSGLNPTGSSTTNGDITLVGQAVAGGDVLLDLTPAANTAVTTEVPDFIVRAHTNTVTGTVATYRFNQFLAPTLTAVSSITTTTAATLYIDNAPQASGSAAITTPLALWVDDGNVRFDGFLGVGTSAPATTQLYVKAQSSGNVTARIDSASGATVDILQVQRNAADQLVVSSVGRLIHTPTASSATTPRTNFITAADTGMTASTEAPFMRFGGDSSGNTVSRQWNTGSLSTQRENIFVGPTYAFVGASTLTDAITVDIGTPTAGTNATITRSTGLRVKPAAAAHHGIWVDGTVSYTGDALALGQSGAKIVRFVGSGGTVNAVLKADGALASNATDGFTYLPEYAATGAPTGTPTSYTGAEPVVFQRDNVNGVYDLWAYSNSAWRSIGGQFKRYDTASGSGSQTLDFNSSASANVTRAFTATGNVTFTAWNNPPAAGSLVTVILIQDGTGGWTWSFPSSVKFAAATPPTWSTGAGKKDTAQFVYDGSNYNLIAAAIDVR